MVLERSLTASLVPDSLQPVLQNGTVPPAQSLSGVSAPGSTQDYRTLDRHDGVHHEIVTNTMQRNGDAGTTTATTLDSVTQNIPAIHCDVAIVGGGIVGLTLAAALKSSGLKVVIVDASPRQAGLRRRRAYAVTLMSGRILSGLGIWPTVLPQVTTFNTIRLADATCPTILDLQPGDLGTTELGYVAEHGVLVSALHQHLTDMEHLIWWDTTTLTDAHHHHSGVTLFVQRDGQPRRIEAKVLIAADGARSPIRQRTQIKTDGWKYWQSCVTAVIRPEHDHGNIAREHFWPSGPFATLPLPGNRCQIVLTAPHQEAQRYMAMTDDEFLAVLDERYGHQLGQLELLTPRQLFPVQLMHSRQYIRSRLALVGDAAHCCHPVGGQGMNLGIRDAAALAQVLTTAHQRGQDIGSTAVLKQYERWRWWENLAILAFTDALDRSFSTDWFAIRVLRRLMLRLMKRIGILKRVALWLMTGGLGRSPRLALFRSGAIR